MILIGTRADAALDRIPYLEDGLPKIWKGQMIVPADGDPRRPNAFLVEQTPGHRLGVHFHAGSQFQVILRGAGQFGAHAIAPLMVHYAGQRTPYGPIVAGGDSDLWYLTLRPCYEAGVYWMPESSALRDRAIPRRERFAQAAAAGAEGVCLAQGVACEVLIEAEEDGLGAWLVRLPAGTMVAAPDAPRGAGRYHVVVGGSATIEGRPLDWAAVVWADAEHAPLMLAAGPAGAEVLVLQYPVGALDHPPPARAATQLVRP